MTDDGICWKSNTFPVLLDKRMKFMDKRIKKTKRAIRTLLLELMETDQASKITVSEICNHIEINRSTFYSHYEGIDDVLAEIEDELMEDIVQTVQNQSGNDFNAVLKEISNSISSNKHIYQTLAKSYEFHFTNKLRMTISSLLSLDSKREEWEPKLEHSHSYIRAFIVSGIIGLLLEWLKYDCRDTMLEVSNELQRYFYLAAIN